MKIRTSQNKKMPKKSDIVDIAVLKADVAYIKSAIDDIKNSVSQGQNTYMSKETCETKHTSFDSRLTRLENIVYGLLLTVVAEAIALIFSIIKLKS